MSTVIPWSSFTYQEQRDTLTHSQPKTALIGLLFLSFEFASGLPVQLLTFSQPSKTELLATLLVAAKMNAQRTKKEPSGNKIQRRVIHF